MKSFKKKVCCMSLMALALASPAGVQAEGKATDQPLAVVNGVPISSEYGDLLLRDRGIPGEQVTEDLKQEVTQRLVTNELFVQEALKMGFDKDSEIALRSEMLWRDVMANAYVNWYLQTNPVSESQIKSEYESRKAKLDGEKEYSVRHILVPDKDQARKIIGKLETGADFGELADAYSLDQGGSKNYGGSLGWISIETSEPLLTDAAGKLRVGQVTSAPVQTRFGWHVIQLDGVRDIRILPFDTVKDRLRQQLRQQLVANLEQQLRDKASIKRELETQSLSRAD